MDSISPADQVSKAGAAVLNEFKSLTDHADELVKSTASITSADYAVVREKLMNSISSMRETLVGLEKAALDSTKKAAVATDKYVHENPWPAIGAAAVAGGLIGYLLRASHD